MGERQILWKWEYNGCEWYAWIEDGEVWYCETRNDYEWHDKCKATGPLKSLILHALSKAKEQDLEGR